MNALLIIQARMSSRRLPGKVLEDLEGAPMLARVVSRARRCPGVDAVLVATSTGPEDDPVAACAAALGVLCHRGSRDDVLDRFYQAAKPHRPERVIRVTADCPFIDPQLIALGLQRHTEGWDYVSNVAPATFPDGLDFEVFTFAALERAWNEARLPAEREHVTPWIRNHPDLRKANILSSRSSRWSRLRLTVDDPQDLAFARMIWKALGRDDFSWGEVIDLLEQQPQLMQHQSHAVMNAGYYHSLYEQAVAGPASPRPLPVSQRLLERAQAVIPGAAQTFSKSTSQYVQRVSPVFLQRGEGCRVWDVDGHAYIDYVQGLLPNILGYGCQAVDDAFHAQARHGHSFSLPHPLEVELAERLTRIIPCAEMVRFCKNGSDATAGAVRVARAFTGREHIACCGYHGWQDWYIGSTTRNGGVPQAVRDLTHPFAFNNLASLEAVFAAHPGGVAAVIMEPFNFTEPQPGFLEAVRDLAHRHGALLIYDEICTGFHFGLGGVQKIFGITPDLACFGKAMGNGYPIACIAGRRDVMKVFEDVFFSFTFGGEVASMAAAMAVLDILEHTDALQRIEAQGRRIQDGFNALAQEAGLYPRFECVGRPQWSLMKFRNTEGQDSLLERSLFQQEAVKRGILHLVTHNMTAAHDDAAVDQTLTAYAAVFKTLALWLADSQPTRFLEGPMIQPVFRVR
jgi:glutamate-1-semialdehyde 2,1-aminomutase/spore coat polysaccharide biosynthesis protein SpsF